MTDNSYKLPVEEDNNRDLQAGEKQKKGHRRIDEQGEVSYKKVPTNTLMSSIQLGIANSIGSLASLPKRDLLLQDFQKVDCVAFPAQGSLVTPSHSFGDYRFKTYAPIAFRYFRELFNIKTADFLKAICTESLQELLNAGASGSIFYVSYNDQFIIKTVQHKEAEFLQKLLPGYYMNLQQNKSTFLPKFYGLFCYQSLGKNIRLLVMNNLLPQSITIHEKYDIKGSTYKRFGSKAERAKPFPTLKDLDFLEQHREGLSIDPVTCDWLLKTISRDCLVLESFKIMDYSLLIGIHKVGKSKEKIESEENCDEPYNATITAEKNKACVEDDAQHPQIYAVNANGEKLILYLGIIDILQNYRLFKKVEHTWKAIMHDGASVSVHNPSFYAERFLSFITTSVFRKNNSLKTPPSRQYKKSVGDDVVLSNVRDVTPVAPGAGRRTYKVEPRLQNDKEKRKGERLFATPKSEENGGLSGDEQLSPSL